MRRKEIIYLLVSVLFMSFLFSQAYRGRGRLIGHVYDDKGNPLEGVEVKLYSVRADSGFTVKTDKEGLWKALWIRGGTWYIDFYKIGYEPKKITVEVKEIGKNPEIDIKLKKLEGLFITPELEKALEKGNKLFNEKKYKEAIEVYGKILKDFPDAYIINLNMGNCYFQMQDYDKAIEYYKKVLEKNPEHVPTLIAMGNAYLNKGNTEEAMKWYGKIDIEKIDDPTVLYNVGTIYYNNGKYDLALKYYQKCVEVSPKFFDALYQLGLTYMAISKFKEAIDTFNKYLTIDKDSERAQIVRESIKYLEDALKEQKGIQKK